VRILLVGPPGSGKGTQAVRIAEHFGIEHISSGDLLRGHIARATPTGQAADAYVRRGDLVPDGLVMDVLRKPVEAASRAGGYVLDGFPRTLAQAEAAYQVAKDLGASVQVAVSLEVPREELVRRLLERAGAAGRSDDREDVIRHRLEVFDKVTPPMLAYYDRREVLLTIDGSRPVAEVTKVAIEELERVAPKLRDS
jgi:adenylate kinase